ncbi:unnamed protein product [Penicillium salamii]|uniref:glucose oxidase n=1 Tax=Penicillium salamii TaxID=1612424 RepID=A0A9W4NME2_9EURO|nr:unnamed protein product [Penicillium salamii]CAG7976636.1 unnamed protein product [Penicillium salamii]CAG8034557.1 unnamed protein product [Penicillium salamii]CAG8057230.1 unnamed protein product [Penicillium salamii]CAG8102868.1 unnamed protein product [Penicillium salamii]
MLVRGLSIVALALGAAARNPHGSAPQYAFVIVGGGTCGLVVANRLSELENVTVAVIEAGDSVFNNVNVTNFMRYGLAFGTEIDWAYETANQTYTDALKHIIRAGKAIGGTRMSYTRAEDAQIDNWERVGNQGWGWKDLLPYYKKSEDFQIPTKHQASLGASYTDEFHGHSGPLKVGSPNSITNDTVFSILSQTIGNLGVKHNPDANSGHMIGFNDHPDTLDKERNIRADAAHAYYWRYESRSNLKNIYARKEIILSAGAVRSLQLLEISGVGNPEILSRHNISINVALSSVGENLQDQTDNPLSWEFNETFSGLVSFSALISINQLYGSNVSALKRQIDSSIGGYAKILSNKTNGAVKQDRYFEFLKIQRNLIFDSLVPYVEIVFVPRGQDFVIEYWPLQPFSRGNIDAARYIRKIFETAPLAGTVGDELIPSCKVLPHNASRATWQRWVKDNYRPNCHFVGTNSMLPREKGGVVSSELRVYGTQNVRVVDASIMPFQISGHLSSTLYAIAEKASDMIKDSYRH